MKSSVRFIIFAPAYTEKIGGTLVLHYLCHYLNQNGYKAYLWQKHRVLQDVNKPLYQVLSDWKRNLKVFLRKRKFKSGFLNTPIAKQRYLKDAIIVYPEVIAGNPLKAKNIVRWFLYKPGDHTGIIDYGSDELYFYYNESFNIPSLGRYENQKFFFSVVLNDIFIRKNFGKRNGKCVILRKGKNRISRDSLSDFIIIDDLDNNYEIAKAFNECEFCYCYDLYTFYSKYAALCGCKTIVIPKPGLSKYEWQPNEESRYGIAYGEENIEWAIETQDKLMEKLNEQQEEAMRNVALFAEQCLRLFTVAS